MGLEKFLLDAIRLHIFLDSSVCDGVNSETTIKSLLDFLGIDGDARFELYNFYVDHCVGCAPEAIEALTGLFSDKIEELA